MNCHFFLKSTASNTGEDIAGILIFPRWGPYPPAVRLGHFMQIYRNIRGI